MSKHAQLPGNSPLKESDLIPTRRRAFVARTPRASGNKCPEGRSMISVCLRTALLEAGSSVVAAETSNISAAVAIAALSAIVTISACTVIIIQSWNRDASIIDARARSWLLRRWGRRASTLAEIERVATFAILPMVLLGGGKRTDT
jgi:hypothetical protein